MKRLRVLLSPTNGKLLVHPWSPLPPVPPSIYTLDYLYSWVEKESFKVKSKNTTQGTRTSRFGVEPSAALRFRL